MKKILLAIAAVIVSLAANAQGIEIYKGSTLVATYAGSDYKAVLTKTPGNLIQATFSVAADKKVQFTKSNLYWNGSDFQFEANQTDYQTEWNASYVDHFFWTKTASSSYANSYSDGTNAITDVPFFAESTGGLTVEGTSGLFALSSSEWYYLLSGRTNAANLCKNGVTVTNNGSNYTNCLIIAPDGYSGTALSEITDWSLSNINSLGLVCLPAAGYRRSSTFWHDENYGMYWSSTPDGSNVDNANYLYILSTYTSIISNSRNAGYSLRLVK